MYVGIELSHSATMVGRHAFEMCIKLIGKVQWHCTSSAYSQSQKCDCLGCCVLCWPVQYILHVAFRVIKRLYQGVLACSLA